MLLLRAVTAIAYKGFVFSSRWLRTKLPLTQESGVPTKVTKPVQPGHFPHIVTIQNGHKSSYCLTYCLTVTFVWIYVVVLLDKRARTIGDEYRLADVCPLFLFLVAGWWFLAFWFSDRFPRRNSRFSHHVPHHPTDRPLNRFTFFSSDGPYRHPTEALLLLFSFLCFLFPLSSSSIPTTCFLLPLNLFLQSQRRYQY